MGHEAIEIARAVYAAYVAKDRAAIEALIADDFHFTSPIDNALDRDTYFARCWPNSASMSAVTVVQSVVDSERAFIVYEAGMGIKRVRNCEVQHRSKRQAGIGRGVFRLGPPPSGGVGQLR